LTILADHTLLTDSVMTDNAETWDMPSEVHDTHSVIPAFLRATPTILLIAHWL